MQRRIFCRNPTKVMIVLRIRLLYGEFESLTMDDSESISTYFDRVQVIMNLININGEV